MNWNFCRWEWGNERREMPQQGRIVGHVRQEQISNTGELLQFCSCQSNLMQQQLGRPHQHATYVLRCFREQMGELCRGRLLQGMAWSLEQSILVLGISVRSLILWALVVLCNAEERGRRVISSSGHSQWEATVWV